MYTLNARTGKKTGQVQTGYYINGTASVWKNYMLFGGCDAWVRMVDVTTGVMTDSLQLDSYVPASPAILDGVACACDYNGNIYELTLDGGHIASHCKLLASDDDNDGQEGGVVSMPTLTRDAVYFLSGDRNISCFDRSSGKLRWKKMLRGMTGECAPLVARDKVLVCTKDGHISLLNTQDGSELWHYEAGEPIIASPAIVANRFFILTTRGTLLCFN
jgi:outer membrane protein assembly factor BamB